MIKVRNISKRYRLGVREQAYTFAGQLKNTLLYPIRNWRNIQRMKRFGDDDDPSIFWALRDINFEVKRGEVIGIIGHNGAGKSTLLKILSRITEPTSGEIEIKGRLSSLLEVGTGFHPELTGRENAYMNGTILGMTKKEIDQKFDEIVAFAGVEKHIDTPVKFYSSGMQVRLGFSVAAHLEPEILVIDEVLAVGDAEFQRRCLGKMEDVAHSGRTVLFVSHNMGSVRNLCETSMILKKGGMMYIGDTESAINSYMIDSERDLAQGKAIIAENAELKYQILQIALHNARDEITHIFASHDVITLKINLVYRKKITGSRLVMQVLTLDGLVIFASTNHEKIKDLQLHGYYQIECRIPPNLLKEARYKVRLHAGIPHQEYLLKPKDYLFFEIISKNPHHGSSVSEAWPGIISPVIDWTIKDITTLS